MTAKGRRRSAGPQAGRRLGDMDYRALGDFRRALRELLAFSDGGAREAGLTSQQHQALLAIRSHAGPEPMTIGELADCLMIKNHSAVGLVARLVERDLVARRGSAEDRRRVLLELRPRGAEILEKIALRNVGEYRRAAAHMAQVLTRVRRLQPTEAEAAARRPVSRGEPRTPRA